MEAVKKGVELVEETKTFKRINGRFTDQAWPGCEHLPFKSDAYYEWLVQNLLREMSKFYTYSILLCSYVTHFSVTLHHV